MTAVQQKFDLFAKDIECDIFYDEPLCNHCTFKIGGNAEILVVPKNEKSLCSILTFIKNNKIPLHTLGNGSNVLISDKGLRGITLKMMNGLTDIIYLGDGIIGCSAGVSLKKLCMFAYEHSLTGLEFAYGIPGSVGGALYMNAGAYNGAMKDVLLSVRSVDIDTSLPCETKLEDLTYEYRNTSFMKNKNIITAGYFKLSNGDKDIILSKMEELLSKRRSSQPLEYPSAGSTFKRPEIGYAAAHIDQCGLKGTTVGGASVSTKHAGFVINNNNATFNDVIELMNIIQKTVYEQHSVMLEPEVEILKD